jgi:hypothetical protein
MAKSKVAKQGEKIFAYGKTAGTSAWANIARNDYGKEKHSDDDWLKYRNKVKNERKNFKDRFGVH